MRKRALEEALRRAQELRPSKDVIVAALAVAMILEQHAEVMATDVGAAVAAYQDAVQRARRLSKDAATLAARSSWLWDAYPFDDEGPQKDAAALYEELTT